MTKITNRAVTLLPYLLFITKIIKFKGVLAFEINE